MTMPFTSVRVRSDAMRQSGVERVAEAEERIRVMVVDDHPLARAGLVLTLEHEGCEIVAELGTAEEALAVARMISIDVAVVDVLMPRMSGITLASELHEIQPSCCVVGLSVVDEPGLIADMLRAHARGFALKTQPIPEVVEAIRHLATSELPYLPPSVDRAAVDRALATPTGRSLTSLTRREREVFELVIRGHSNDEIATKLCVSRRTIEAHRLRVSKKLSARSVAELQRVAALHGAALGL